MSLVESKRGDWPVTSCPAAVLKAKRSLDCGFGGLGLWLNCLRRLLAFAFDLNAAGFRFGALWQSDSQDAITIIGGFTLARNCIRQSEGAHETTVSALY